MLDVLFARPHDLQRSVDLLRDAHSTFDHVGFEPPAEAAAKQMIVQGHLIDWNPRLRRGRLRAGQDLRTDPYFAGARSDRTVQFIGSMVACAKNGSSYSASRSRPVRGPWRYRLATLRPRPFCSRRANPPRYPAS